MSNVFAYVQGLHGRTLHMDRVGMCSLIIHKRQAHSVQCDCVYLFKFSALHTRADHIVCIFIGECRGEREQAECCSIRV